MGKRQLRSATRIVRSAKTGRIRIECVRCRKIAYPSRKMALDGATRRLDAYLGKCGHWHLTSRRRGR